MLVMGPLDEPSVRRAIDLDVAVTVLERGDGRRRSSTPPPTAPGAADASRACTSRSTPAWVAGACRSRDATPRSSACSRCEGVEVEGVMTHFATADDARRRRLLRPAARALRARSSRRRASACRASSRTPPTAPRRCATTRAHFDAVRCGVATYGLDPMQHDPDEPRPRAGAVAALARRRRARAAGGREHRLQPHVHRRRDGARRARADRLRRRRASRARQPRQRARARRRAPDRRQRQHGPRLAARRRRRRAWATSSR